MAKNVKTHARVEGGLPCAKTIIDNGYGLIRFLSCMNASILIAVHSDIEPTDDHLNRFLSLSEPLAKLSAEIEAYVRTGGGTTGREQSSTPGRVIGQSTNTSDIILGNDPVEVDIDMIKEDE